MTELPGWLARRLLELPPAGWQEMAPGDSGDHDLSWSGSGFRPVEGKLATGGRNAYLAQFAGWAMRKGVAEESLLAVLASENDRACDPPLPPREVAQVARSIARYHR